MVVVTMNDEKNIEIVNGNGDLNISPVTDYIEIEKPKPKITEEIVIPEEKKKFKKHRCGAFFLYCFLVCFFYFSIIVFFIMYF